MSERHVIAVAITYSESTILFRWSASMIVFDWRPYKEGYHRFVIRKPEFGSTKLTVVCGMVDSRG